MNIRIDQDVVQEIVQLLPEILDTMNTVVVQSMDGYLILRKQEDELDGAYLTYSYVYKGEKRDGDAYMAKDVRSFIADAAWKILQGSHPLISKTLHEYRLNGGTTGPEQKPSFMDKIVGWLDRVGNEVDAKDAASRALKVSMNTRAPNTVILSYPLTEVVQTVGQASQNLQGSDYTSSMDQRREVHGNATPDDFIPEGAYAQDEFGNLASDEIDTGNDSGYFNDYPSYYDPIAFRMSNGAVIGVDENSNAERDLIDSLALDVRRDWRIGMNDRDDGNIANLKPVTPISNYLNSFLQSKRM